MSEINLNLLKKRQGHLINLSEMLEGLVTQNIISTDSANLIYKTKANSKQYPLVSIAEFNLKSQKAPFEILTLEKLCEWLALFSGFTYQRIDPLKIKLENVSHLIPHSYAIRLNILPIELNENEVVVCTSEPFALSWIDEISPLLKKKIVIKIANPLTIKQLLSEYFVVQTAINKISKTNQTVTNNKLLREGKVIELERILEKNKLKKWAAEDSAVVQVVEWLLQFALNERASDIHLEPKKGMSSIRLRIDGKLRPVYKMEPDILLSVISRFKILADIKIDEKRRPQDGRVKKILDNGVRLEMRISTIPVSHGEKMVIRLFDHQVSGKSLSSIGFSGHDLKKWSELIACAQGLVLVTGPTGSGKTTTLYSSLGEVATPDVNVCTIEDPVEMSVDEFNQVQVNKDIGITFPNAIKSFLRQDPDIIMVGEIRDLETAEMAIQASLTGHMVFSTLHTNTALATIIRLLDLGIPPYLLNASLLGVLSQRLVRKLCMHCKVEIDTPKELWDDLVYPNQVQPPKKVCKAVGCEECKHTGYSGRICVYELVPFTQEIKKLIKAQVQLAELEEKTKGQFTPFKVKAAEKVATGETSLEEVIKVAI